jgi:uncharacterized membrane protein
MKLAHLHKRTSSEPYWHVQLAVIIAIVLQLALNDKLTVGPKYIIAGFECLLLILLAVVVPRKHTVIIHLRRSLATLLIALVSIANISSLVLVVYNLFSTHQVSGKELIVSGLAIYLTNIIIFGLWYWELDTTGNQGQSSSAKPTDFLFPQMGTPTRFEGWRPTFFDYLYISLTNASAFSPTDTMPLTHRAKMLMSLQSTTSLITIALVAARAVNILH